MNPVVPAPLVRDFIGQRIYASLDLRQRRSLEVVEPYVLGTAVGSVRSKNEDVALIARLRDPIRPDRDLDIAVVCDGMGGMARGRYAAQLAASIFVSSLVRQARDLGLPQRVERAVWSAQRAVAEQLRGEGGTTLSAICAPRQRTACIAHVGDSRVYAVTPNVRPIQLTRDDTLAAALNRKDEGHEAGRLIQYVGMYLDRDDASLEPQILGISPALNINGYLLTSDGVHGAPDEAVSRVAFHARDGGDLVRKLLNLADALGGIDNASAVYIPAAMEPAVTDSPGASLSVLTPSGDVQIWLGGSSLGAELDEPRREPTTESKLPPPNAPGQAQNRVDLQRASPKRPKGKKKRPSDLGREKQQAPSLPLEEPSPVVKVHFPEEDRD